MTAALLGQRHHGIGLRTRHFADWLAGPPPVGLVEVISENVAGRGGRPLAVLERVRRDNAVVLHGVSLSIGGGDPLRLDSLRKIAALARHIEAAWVSDHLCFGTYGGHAGYDLWPLPHTEEAIAHLVPRIAQVQEVLGRRLVLENVSSYVQYAASELTEWEFLVAVAERADCEILLDLNNVYVNSRNHGFDPGQYLRGLPRHRLRQLHLAGNSDRGVYVFDSHGGAVADPVWALYRQCVALHGAIPTIIEWDEEVPALVRVLAEAAQAAQIEAEVLAAGAAAVRRSGEGGEGEVVPPRDASHG
jgi:uncharacterized protein